jgi:heptosyltransferase-3
MDLKTARFLVLRGGAIGDFILTLPAMQALRERWPDSTIELIGYPRVARLALVTGLVDRVDSLDRAGMAAFFSRRPEFTDRQCQFIRSFDVIVSYLNDPDGLVRQNLELAGAQQVLYGSPLVEGDHATAHLMKPLEELALFDEGQVPRLELPMDLRDQGLEWLKQRDLHQAVAIHPGSGSPRKNWPLENFVELARRLSETGKWSPFFIMGEADQETAEALAGHAPESCVLAEEDLVDVAAVLAGCDAFIGNDSGITHLAAAVGLTVTALFGPTDPGLWAPRNPGATVLRTPGGNLEDITVDQVYARSVDAWRGGARRS